MAKFLKTTDENGYVSYVNLEMLVDVDVEERKATFAGGLIVTFNDDLNDAEWLQVMNFVYSNIF